MWEQLLSAGEGKGVARIGYARGDEHIDAVMYVLKYDQTTYDEDICEIEGSPPT